MELIAETDIKSTESNIMFPLNNTESSSPEGFWLILNSVFRSLTDE